MMSALALQIAEAADRNLATHGGWIARHHPSMHVDDDAVVVIDSGLRCDTFNLVCAARLSPADAPRRARDVVAHFRDRDRPFSWWTGPADQPERLGVVLEREGLTASESELLMTADLRSLDVTGASAPGLRIERVRTPGQLRDFAEVNAANWDPPDPLVMQFYEMAAPLALSPECPLAFYVGYVDDTPVAAAELTIGGGVAGLYNIATREAYRRRGFGTAMTLRPLLDARDAGHRTAILQAAPDGVGVYTRVGFTAIGEFREYKP